MGCCKHGDVVEIWPFLRYGCGGRKLYMISGFIYKSAKLDFSSCSSYLWINFHIA